MNIEGNEHLVVHIVTYYVKGRHTHLTRPILTSILGRSDEDLDFLMIKDRAKSYL